MKAGSTRQGWLGQAAGTVERDCSAVLISRVFFSSQLHMGSPGLQSSREQQDLLWLLKTFHL